jgi:serine phosphatase RsbU (regulator of sigma subunit)
MVKKYFLIFLGVFCFAFYVKASDADFSYSNRISYSPWHPVYFLNKVDSPANLSDWRIKNGDSAAWASPQLNDATWDTVSPDMFFSSKKFTGNCWLRLHIKVAPALMNKTVVFLVGQAGASEIYLNGKLIKSLGRVGDEMSEEIFNPKSEINYLQLGTDSIQIIAVRFSANRVIRNHSIEPSFSMSLWNPEGSTIMSRSILMTSIMTTLFFAIFMTLSLFHLLLFLYYRKAVSNLYYSILAFLISLLGAFAVFSLDTHNPIKQHYANELISQVPALVFFLIILLLHSIFKERYKWLFWVILGLTIVTNFFFFVHKGIYGTLLTSHIITCSFKGVFMAIRAVRRKQAGAKIIATGFLVFLSLILFVFIFFISFPIIRYIHSDIHTPELQTIVAVISVVWALSIPTSMSFYLASDFARTNKFLNLQLVHVKQLSEQNVAKEREKQHLIERQKEDLVIKVREATEEISKQKDELAEKNKEITDSINYAKRIQTSILPEDGLMRDALGEHAVIFKPKDVVSGDFYWCYKAGDKAIFAVADCTGHGVPGAFMSMIGNSLLNEIVIGEQVTEANSILDSLRSKLIITMQQSAEHVTTRDGMDIALCVWNKKENTLQFAGANNSLYLVSRDIAVNGSIKESAKVKLTNQHLLEIMPDKQPIGYQEDKMNEPFTKMIIQLHPGDSIFITSDGFTDQFGGEKNKKYTSKRFRELIASMVGLPMAEQKIIIEHTIEDWKRNEEQTDDICVMGIRVS